MLAEDGGCLFDGVVRTTQKNTEGITLSLKFH